MEDALTVLSNTPEHPGDEMLVALVQIYKIMEEITQMSWQHPDQSAPGHRGPPPMLYIRGLRLSLENVKQTMSPELLQNRMWRPPAAYFLHLLTRPIQKSYSHTSI